MRIGVNALYMIPGGVGGTEIYLRELLAALAKIDSVNEYFVFTNAETASDLVPAADNFHWQPQRVRAISRPARLLWEQTVLPVAARRCQLDVLFNPGFTAPALRSCPNVTVFHDLQHVRHPEFFRKTDLPFWQLALWLAERSSARIIADSKATAADVQQHYARASTVIPLGVDPAFFNINPAGSGTYLLCVSTLHPHKNIDGLMRAFSRAALKQRLICAGMFGFAAERLHRLRSDLGLTDSVEFTGWVPRDDLFRLYEGAHAIIYPSTFEGFGMPVLEGMASGVPTACSSIPVLQETGGNTVLYFDPNNDDDIITALQRISADEPLRMRLASEARDRAMQFTWERTARETLGVLHDVAHDRR